MAPIQHWVGSARFGRWRGLTEKHEGVALLVEEIDTPFLESEELRALVAEGRERGFLTFEEIAACLEEVEVTKEQVRDLHLHLLDAGIEIVSNESRAGGVRSTSGSSSLRTFGLVVALGVLLGAWLAARYGEEYGIPRDTTYSLAMRMVVAGVIGSRITWVLTHLDELDSPVDAFAIWQGGLQFSGGFVFAVIAGLSRCTGTGTGSPAGTASTATPTASPSASASVASAATRSASTSARSRRSRWPSATTAEPCARPFLGTVAARARAWCSTRPRSTS